MAEKPKIESIYGRKYKIAKGEKPKIEPIWPNKRKAENQKRRNHIN